MPSTKVKFCKNLIFLNFEHPGINHNQRLKDMVRMILRRKRRRKILLPVHICGRGQVPNTN